MFGIDLITATTVKDRIERRSQYVAEQIMDAIDWLEKVTGRKFDDEKFIDGLYSWSETETLWGQINILNQAIPAPLDQRNLFSLYIPAFMLYYRKDSAEFYREMKAEIEWRIQEGYAAGPYERARVVHEAQPPWFWMKIFRIMEQYGCVCVGSIYSNCSGCNYEIDERGIWHAPKTLRERGIVLKNREDAAKYMAHKLASKIIFSMYCPDPTDKNQQLIQIVQQWHCDGVVIHHNRGCPGLAQLQLENRLALVAEGIPVVTYEGNAADFRDFDETQVTDRIESFMEGLGLTKLPA